MPLIPGTCLPSLRETPSLWESSSFLELLYSSRQVLGLGALAPGQWWRHPVSARAIGSGDKCHQSLLWRVPQPIAHILIHERECGVALLFFWDLFVSSCNKKGLPHLTLSCLGKGLVGSAPLELLCGAGRTGVSFTQDPGVGDNFFLFLPSSFLHPKWATGGYLLSTLSQWSWNRKG